MTPWRAQTGPQLTAIQHDLVDEVLYGGAVFGGKSDFLLGDFAQDVPRPYGKHWHGILFRKTYPQLEELISRSKEIYPPWFPGVVWHKTDKTWTWPNGATLKMRFMESDDDWMEYWGHAFTWIGWDEIALWASNIPYLRMKARLRSASAQIPNKRIRASANPGGPGHHWVKTYFGIDRWPMGGHLFEADDNSGMRRMFVKSRLMDNRIGMANDPKYADRLEGLGSPQLVRSLKEGDWNVIAGAFFPEFSVDRHVIEPFEIPSHWVRLRAMDWGSAKPFCVGWYAVSDGEILPRGAIVQYREWYGMEPGQFNVGLKLTAEEVGDGIVEREAPGEKPDHSVLDPAAFAHDGGPSIAERIATRKIYFLRADNTRVSQRGAMSGWDSVRSRLKGEDGKPMVYFFKTCTEIIRTLPALQHDTHRPEDCDTAAEDHAPDTLRYACAARPWVREAPRTNVAKFPIHQSFNELLAARRKKRLREE